MPRLPRVLSKSNIYHIVLRGINRQNIFIEDEDYKRFIKTIYKYKELCAFELFAYCLMENHIHLLIKTGIETIDKVMSRICISFVRWYNKKYSRVGYLFQDRYKSEPIDDNSYFLVALRYILQNPKKAGIIKNYSSEYRWSNYNDFIYNGSESNINFPLDIFSSDRQKAIQMFIDYINQPSKNECIDLEENFPKNDCDAMLILKNYYEIINPSDFQKLDITTRNLYLRELKYIYNIPIRQIERITGISRGIISRV